jgi:methylaspartate mutase epsilon subunit
VKIPMRREKIDENEFLKMRSQVLSQWPTGGEVDLEDAVEYQRNLPEHKNTLKVVERLHAEGRTGLLPRTGTPLLERQIDMCRSLVDAGASTIVLTFDTFTREAQYERVQQGLEESVKTGRAALNGYPMINLGVKNTRKIIESCECPFNTRVHSVSGALGAEIALASGLTSLGNIGIFLIFGCYSKTARLEELIEYNQYIWRLLGYYADRGIIIPTDDHGWQPGFVFPYDVSIACTILESLIMVVQGVRSIIPHVELQGNIWQDIATVRVARRLLRDYLDKFGYGDVTVPGVLSGQLPLYPVPKGMGELFGYSDYTAVVAALAGSELTFVRTLDEGVGVPSEEALKLSNSAAHWVLNVVGEQKVELESRELAVEEEMTEKAVKAIVDTTLKIGDGDPALGSIRAVETGIIDSPFAPNVHVKDQVLGIRDGRGACRYLYFGNLPLPADVKEFHREKVTEREKTEGRRMDRGVAVEDFWAPSQGRLIGRPRKPD